MSIRRFVRSLVGLLLLTVVASGQDVIYVKAKTGEIKEQPKGTAPTLATLEFSESISASELKRRWYSVEYQGVQGWIYSGSVSTEVPTQDPSLQAEDGSALSGEEVDANSAVRGVGPTANRYAGSNSILPIHMKFLDYHQYFVSSDRKITELPPNRQLVTLEDINAFMREGRLGAYAE